MARFKNIIFVLILVFLFVEVLIIFPQYLEKIESDPVAQSIPADKNTAEQKMTDAHLVESRDGSRDWELVARAAEAYQNNKVWEIREVKVNFYNQDKLDYTVTGKTGTVDTSTKDMKISGDVLLMSANGYVFESAEVLYKSQSRSLVSPNPIRMRAPKDDQGDEMILRGNEMLVMVDESRMIVKNDIRASKKISASKNFELTSDTAELSGRSKEVQFLGHVIINYGQTKIEAPVAAFAYAENKNTLKSVQFSGGVRVSDEDKYALSDQMTLDVQMNRFTFTGQPRLYQNNDELNGEQIVFLDGGKKVKVEKIKARVENKKQ